MDLFKQILPSILEQNEYIYDEHESSSYVPYLIERALSGHIDCLPYLCELTLYPNIDKRIHYDYLFYSIRKHKRPFQRWIKYIEPDNLALIMEYYNYSKEKAMEVLDIMTPEQLEYIKLQLEKGGKT